MPRNHIPWVTWYLLLVGDLAKMPFLGNDLKDQDGWPKRCEKLAPRKQNGNQTWKGGLLLRSQVKILSDIQGKWLAPQEEVERHHRWHHSWASFIWLRIWSSPKKSSIKPQFCLYIKERWLNWWSTGHVITRTWSQFPIPTYNRQAGSWLLSELNFQYRATKKMLLRSGEKQRNNKLQLLFYSTDSSLNLVLCDRV